MRLGRIITPSDVVLASCLPVLALLAWCVPERSWARCCHIWARLCSVAHRGKRARLRARIARVFGNRPLPVPVETLVETYEANRHRAWFECLRCYAPGGWQPRTQIVGREHLEAALARGRGAILWVTPMASSDIVTKMALSRDGFSVTHLSRLGHGFSSTRFGMFALNPIWTAVERRYVSERLVMAPGRTAGALRELVRRLQNNGLVSITVSPFGRRVVVAPFIEATIQVAVGAPALARRTGTALLPVFTVRTGDDSFVTIIEALAAPPTLDHDRAVRHLVTAYAALLESYVLRWPTLYRV